ncbi:MAG TPA: DUF2284 domain-containing protein [Methanospirillum sp.]|uniref:DUF2284 domain-containing protein n=1 Tax=Methanospirillum sp. TaxID=45200 RepID=UPI002C9BC3F5|nr:DUF2284 domain-containing protein [Methanospirillum sp.]HWQ64210.1 DUF2284 domain-containing protein [Methanospirillum sp.]
MMSQEPDTQYAFLVEEVKSAGATDAILIHASDIVIEERIQLKCKTGCPSYGQRFSCPPFAPTISEFKQMLQEYQDALLIRFKSSVIAEPEIVHSLLKNRTDPAVSRDIKKRTSQFNEALNEESRKIHDIMLELERTAFLAGNPFAQAFTVDSCDHCKSCNIKGGVCMHPTELRYSIEAVGINIVKTAQAAGMQITFPCPIPPDRITLLLIK